MHTLADNSQLDNEWSSYDFVKRIASVISNFKDFSKTYTHDTDDITQIDENVHRRDPQNSCKAISLIRRTDTIRFKQIYNSTNVVPVQLINDGHLDVLILSGRC